MKTFIVNIGFWLLLFFVWWQKLFAWTFEMKYIKYWLIPKLMTNTKTYWLLPNILTNTKTYWLIPKMEIFTNQLFKLTELETTGPWSFLDIIITKAIPLKWIYVIGITWQHCAWKHGKWMLGINNSRKYFATDDLFCDMFYFYQIIFNKTKNIQNVVKSGNNSVTAFWTNSCFLRWS